MGRGEGEAVEMWLSNNTLRHLGLLDARRCRVLSLSVRRRLVTTFGSVTTSGPSSGAEYEAWSYEIHQYCKTDKGFQKVVTVRGI